MPAQKARTPRTAPEPLTPDELVRSALIGLLHRHALTPWAEVGQVVDRFLAEYPLVIKNGGHHE